MSSTPPAANGHAPSTGALTFVRHPWIVPDKIEQREYQLHLGVAASSHPTLVVIPTGLGKTVIALLVMADRLASQPGSKILVLAPTKPLVDQHRRFFATHLRLGDKGELIPNTAPDAAVVTFSGSTAPAARAEAWHDATVIVATPQVIENDLIASRYDLNDVSCVVFDEVHRATGDYPYVWISERYRRDNPHGHRLGLTASPGSSSERILETCLNAGLRRMEIRTEQDADVQPYVHELQMDWVKVPLPESVRPIADALNSAIKERVANLRSLGFLKGAGSRPGRRDLLALAGEIQARIRLSDEPDRSLFDAMTLQAQALKISHAVELVETQGAPGFLAYWERLRNEAEGRGASKATTTVLADDRIKAAVQRAVAAQDDDPKTDRVATTVRAELTVNDDARIIVFTNYRETAERVTATLAQIPGCRPARFVGQASREGDKGLTQKEQRGLLSDFRKGVHNVLVATSVAEEGLDVPQTDLVIFYEPVPSEIRAIQRRGRTARHRAGRVVLLMYGGTRDEAYHWASKRREKDMRRELRNLRAQVVKALDAGEVRRRETVTTTLDDIQPSATTAPRAATVRGQTTLPDPDQGPAPIELPAKTDGAVTIVVDHREARSGVVKALERRGVRLDPQQLTVADYALSDRVVVERKTVDDFLDSLVDGRLFQQAKQMCGYQRPMMILEGDGLATSRNLPRASVYGALAALATDFGITVLPSRDADETADLLLSIARREQTESRRVAPVRLDKTAMSDHERRRFILEGLPNVSGVLARRLLDAFGSVRAVMDADVEALCAVDGVGRKTAEEIRRVVDETAAGNEKGALVTTPQRPIGADPAPTRKP